MEKYIIDKKVLTVTVLENEKTPSKSEIIEVTFEDGSKEKMPKVRFELIVTDSPSDLSTVSNLIKNRVAAMVFGLLHEYGIKWGEVNSVVDLTVELVNNGFQKASDIKWGVIDKDLITLNDINNVLVENYAKENSDGTTPSGSQSN